MPKISEKQDEAAVKVEVGGKPTVSSPRVTIMEEQAPPADDVPEQTKAEQAEGAKLTAEAEKAAKEAAKAAEKSE